MLISRMTLKMLAACVAAFALLLSTVMAPDADALTYYGIDDGYGYGDITASGQPFDPFGSTAAHPTAPLGSVMEVCGPLACEMVTINDRCACAGPDVTKGVALRIGLI